METAQPEGLDDIAGELTGSSSLEGGSRGGVNYTQEELGKVQDLLMRHRTELTEIYRYYCALGENSPENMYTLGCHQFCQLCKDCQIPTKMFPLSICEALFTESCNRIKVSELPMKSFFSLLVKVGVKRYPELGNVFRQLKACLEERVLANAKKH